MAKMKTKMKKYTQRQIKNYIRDHAAKDITNYNFNQMKEFLHARNLEKVAYSSGIYGLNAGLLRDCDTGELFAITARNSALFLAIQAAETPRRAEVVNRA